MTGDVGVIAHVFDSCRREGRAVLIGFLAAGDPDLEAALEFVRGALRGGVDVLELGVPFSDPLADGPIIQAAYGRALESGATVRGVLELVRAIRQGSTVPIVLMTAWNPVVAYEPRRFAADAAAAGANAVLVPDLLTEDAADFRAVLRSVDLDTVSLAAPGTTDARLRAAAAASSGFLYFISRRGVTGPAGGLGTELEENVARARRAGARTVAVGFGVSTRKDVERVARCADGVIVGSALVRAGADAYADAVARGASRDAAAGEGAQAIERLAADLAQGLKQQELLKEGIAE